jgi:anti-sigma B factor antagonist/stage II sporulation protein AA (anti-sigma F factor antagonist)
MPFSYTESDRSRPGLKPPPGGRTVHITTQQFADTTVVAASGRIDHRSAADLESALLPLVDGAARRGGALVLDFSKVDYISSVGLRVLMIAARQMRAAQARLSVAALQSVVAEIFTISRFDKVLTVNATLEDALSQASDAALAAFRAPRPA